jgi:serralysin
VTLPGNLAPGTYYIGGIADYNNHVSESNEINNTYNVVQITVPTQATAAAAPPDLSEYVGVSNTTVAAGGSVTIDAYAMNIGNGVSGASTAQIYLSSDATITTSDTVLATLNSGTLATVSQPGYYDHQTVSVTLPGNLAPGTYYIGGIADYNNHVSESDETNNTYNVVQITVPAPAASAASTAVNAMLGGHPGGDNFVFAANFSKGTIANNAPALDHIQFNHLAATFGLDAAHENAWSAAEASAMLHGAAADMLQHHLGDFHLV